MLFPTSSPLLTKQDVAISSNGESVIWTIGNVPIPVHYEHAFAISRWIRLEARLIKGLTGRGRTLRSIGVLEDSEQSQRPLPRASGVAIHVKQKLQTWKRSDVGSEGRLVRVQIGTHTIEVHYENALKIAQWLRVRAKESKRRAGDNDRHWSEIGVDE